MEDGSSHSSQTLNIPAYPGAPKRVRNSSREHSTTLPALDVTRFSRVQPPLRSLFDSKPLASGLDSSPDNTADSLYSYSYKDLAEQELEAITCGLDSSFVLKDAVGEAEPQSAPNLYYSSSPR